MQVAAIYAANCMYLESCCSEPKRLIQRLTADAVEDVSQEMR